MTPLAPAFVDAVTGADTPSSRPAPADHPLIERLVTAHGARRVTRDTVADWEAEPGAGALLFAGDPVRFPEGLDVAVVLPEVRAACGTAFRLGVVPRADEEVLARRYGSNRWPSIVFLRDGAYLGTVSGMKDWDVFVEAVTAVLAATPGRAPTVGIPVVRAGDAADAPTCH